MIYLNGARLKEGREQRKTKLVAVCERRKIGWDEANCELRLVSNNQNGWKIIQTIKLFFNIAFLPSTEINRQFVNNQFISND